MSLTCCLNVNSLAYTSCYCEENIWKLCERIKSQENDQLGNCYVVFVSNQKEMVPIWGQKSGNKREDHLVVWDYHVILIHSTDQKAFVYDFDTVLEFPTDFKEYCINNFRASLAKAYFNCHHQFRVISAQEYLQTFASDRSRMKNKDGTFIKPPPNYDCIRTVHETNNLNMFISMNQSFPIGQVMDLQGLLQKFALK